MNFSSFLRRLPAARVLSKTKDSLAAVGAKDGFNALIRPYGRVLDFQLNTRERTLFASLRLKGEVEALQFWVRPYKVAQNKKGETFIVVDGKRRRHIARVVNQANWWPAWPAKDPDSRAIELVEPTSAVGKELGGVPDARIWPSPKDKNSFLGAAIGVRRFHNRFFDSKGIYVFLNDIGIAYGNAPVALFCGRGSLWQFQPGS